MYVQLLSSASTFSISSIAHIFADYSKATSNLLFSLDRSTISTLLASISNTAAAIHLSNFPSKYRQPLLFLYTLVNSCMSLKISYNVFKGHKMRPLTKVLLYGSQILLGVVPVLLEMVMYRKYTYTVHLRKYLLAVIGWVALGGLFYSAEIPERYSPGTFDYFGAGHQIMHVCTTISCWYAFLGVCHWSQHKMLAQINF